MNTVDGFDADLMGSTFEHLILDRQIDQDVLLKILIINMSSLYTKSYIPLQGRLMVLASGIARGVCRQGKAL
jgi:hypothetical protein